MLIFAVSTYFLRKRWTILLRIAAMKKIRARKTKFQKQILNGPREKSVVLSITYFSIILPNFSEITFFTFS